MRGKLYLLSLVFSSILGGVITLSGYFWLNPEKKNESIAQKQNRHFANYSPISPNIKVPDGINFIQAAQLVRPAVVHVKISYSKKSARNHKDGLDDLIKDYHGQYSFPRQSSGSGVIISADGYIATNNHVIDEAGSIEVILNDKRRFTARVVGTDPATDLALLKIDETDLPFVKYGNSDGLQIGEWVLAIGNPFDLTSTVTAGIVSAKGRSINLLDDNYAIESFIQTDAAVNPGNSGGALVNLNGELVGVNTAIATHTGYYAGYSFAVPINLVKKVMDDLMNYGEAQRALLGVIITGVDAELAEEKKLGQIKGVYVDKLMENGAAQLAGLKVGDVIISIDKIEVNSSPDLQSVIGTHRPGDKVDIAYLRQGKKLSTKATLRNKVGELGVIKKAETEKANVLGAEFSKISPEEKKRLSVNYGVKVVSLGKGKIKESGMRAGFIILQVDGNQIKSIQDLRASFLNSQKNKKTVAIDGVYPNGSKHYYALGW